jgi:hypothetical protein
MLAPLLRKALLSLALIGAFVEPAYAAGGQTGILSGTVVDATNSAVPNADILVAAPDGRYRAHTDAKGKFQILGADVDTYTITFQKGGFKNVVETGVPVIGDQTTDIGTITLQKS